MKPSDLIGFADFKIPFLKIPKLMSLRNTFNEPINFRLIDGTTDTVVVLVHGMGGDSRYLTQLALQFSQSTRHTILLPDLKFHGEGNQDRAVKLLPYQDIVTELQFLLDNLKNKYSQINKVVLVGHSLGGAVVLKWLLSQPKNTFQKVGLISPYLPEPFIVESKRFNQWLKRADDGKLLLKFPEQAKWGSEIEDYDSSYIKSCLPENLDIQACADLCSELFLFVSDADQILDVEKYKKYFENDGRIKLNVQSGFSHIGLVTSPQSGHTISSILFTGTT